MSKVKPQLARLLFIDEMLRKNNFPNCSTITDKYEVSSKTIQRDIEYMKYMYDAPIEYNSSKKGFYYTEPNYYLPAINIKESDFFAICIAEKALEQYENTQIYGHLSSVFEKISKLTISIFSKVGGKSLSPPPKAGERQFFPTFWEFTDIKNSLIKLLRKMIFFLNSIYIL